MKKLSPAQQHVVDRMRESNSLIVTGSLHAHALLQGKHLPWPIFQALLRLGVIRRKDGQKAFAYSIFYELNEEALA